MRTVTLRPTLVLMVRSVGSFRLPLATPLLFGFEPPALGLLATWRTIAVMVEST
jgi:hypothetical protein